jgi:transcriptional regulator with XRE-family HTH domain
MHPKTKQTIKDARNWANQSFGRRAQLARHLGVARSLITDWFEGRRVPTADQIFQIQDFLAKQKPPRKDK